jgi:hypothetical protein
MFWRKKIKFNNGALPDIRPQERKDLDYVQSELVASVAPVVWVKKEKYLNYPVRKQDGSGSCVMQSLEKERGIIAEQKYGEFVVFSANPGYQLRANPNISGSTIDDLINSTNYGSIPESLSPSQSMNDLQMMKAKLPTYTKDVAKIFGAKRIFMDLDIDTVASTIENTGKGVGLTMRFGKGEWFYNYIVKELTPESHWVDGHRVTAVDNTLDNDGRKCLVIEDSACEDGYPVRLVPESFFLRRTYWKPNYILNFKSYAEIGETPVKPKFDGSIISAQKCFAYEGLFPANTDFVENWGPVTRKACIEFQKRYNIVPALGNFGPITKEKLSEIYQ